MKSHQQFLEEVYAKSKNIIICSEYKGFAKNVDAYCKLCGNKWTTKAYLLREGCQCPKCHGKVLPIEKSLLSTHPEIAKLMKNEDDRKRYSYGSEKRVEWICPCCGETVYQKPISTVVRFKHVPCKKCSDGISYPNKYMYSMLTQLNEKFETEYSPEWIFPKKYDFYVPSKKLIIEMDGAIGHGNRAYDGSSGEKLYQIDRYKDACAKEHGLTVVRIDCYISDSDYISGNIINSELSETFNLALVDWDKCNFDGYSSLKKKVIDIWNDCGEMEIVLKNTGLSRTTIIKYLHDGTKYGWCNYDPKEQQKRSGYRNIKKAICEGRKKVVCLNNGKVFDSIREANTWAGLSLDAPAISKVCRGIKMYETAGRHPVTHERLRWAFYENYKKAEAI